MTKMFRTCALGGCMIVLNIPQKDGSDFTHQWRQKLERDGQSSMWNISPPWTMTERPTRQRRAKFLTEKSLKSLQVNSDYFIFKMFCSNVNNERAYAASQRAKEDDDTKFQPQTKCSVNVGDLFVQDIPEEAHDGHDEEEALEDEEESEGSDDTVW